MNADQARRLGVEREWEAASKTFDAIHTRGWGTYSIDALVDALATRLKEMGGRRCEECEHWLNDPDEDDGIGICDEGVAMFAWDCVKSDFACNRWTARKPTEEGSS